MILSLPISFSGEFGHLDILIHSAASGGNEIQRIELGGIDYLNDHSLFAVVLKDWAWRYARDMAKWAQERLTK